MSPVDRAGPVSEISAHPLIALKKSRRVHMRERAGSVAEISVFPTGISVSGLEILPYEHFSPVTGRKIIQCIFAIERTLPRFYFSFLRK